MERITNYIFIFLALSFTNKVLAQVPEIGVLAGGSYYIGDLNPYKHFYNTKPAGSIYYRNQIAGSDRLSYRIQASYGTVEAFDSESSNIDFVNRNLNFRSRIVELGGLLEINFLPYEIGSNKRPGTPYLFFGLSYMKMNPTGQYGDEWIELQSLHTEGQETEVNDDKLYRLNQIVLPFGVGIKVNISKRLSLGLEYGLRKTFTDYLDDVSGNYVNPAYLKETFGSLSAEMSDPSLDSQASSTSQTTLARGNSNTKDWYAFTGLTLSFRIFEYTTCPKKW